MIRDLALILIVAGITTIVFKKLRQPLVLGYLVAGFLVSPHMPYTMSVVDEANIHSWADIGVMFTLFSLGLDFSFKKILKMGASPIISTVIIIFCMMALGISVGYTFGWAKMDCIFLGGMLAMSSTTIIYKAFDDLGTYSGGYSGHYHDGYVKCYGDGTCEWRHHVDIGRENRILLGTVARSGYLCDSDVPAFGSQIDQ